MDPGGGTQRAKEAIRYRSGAVHGLVSIDDADPSPHNYQWYNEAFRHQICDSPPRLTRTDTTVTLRHGGFMRLRGGKAVGPLVRVWRFAGGEVSMEDHVETTVPVTLRRRLVTPLVVAPPEDDGSVLLWAARAAGIGWWPMGRSAAAVSVDTLYRLWPEGSGIGPGDGHTGTRKMVRPCAVDRPLEKNPGPWHHSSPGVSGAMAVGFRPACSTTAVM
ncbi:MAG: hypothetical protein FD149_405 [Rhodospirillaceae bacterium]|nr:MAG: hypothetical protein FD149_405 [Rhodospirillaceae bacterium]